MSQSEEHKANEAKANEAKTAVKMLMMLSGTDIIMPEPKREEVIKELGLEESIEFHRAMGEISLVDPKTQYKIIQGLMVSFLTSTQLMGMGDYAREVPKMTMDYCAEHKEYLHIPTPEEFAARLG
jgi:hypothetical protein